MAAGAAGIASPMGWCSPGASRHGGTGTRRRQTPVRQYARHRPSLNASSSPACRGHSPTRSRSSSGSGASRMLQLGARPAEELRGVSAGDREDERSGSDSSGGLSSLALWWHRHARPFVSFYVKTQSTG